MLGYPLGLLSFGAFAIWDTDYPSTGWVQGRPAMWPWLKLWRVRFWNVLGLIPIVAVVALVWFTALRAGSEPSGL